MARNRSYWPAATILDREQVLGGSKRQYIFENKDDNPILERGRGELHAEPHVRPIPCHVASLSWQEPEEELNKLLPMKVSDMLKRQGKMLVVLRPFLVFRRTAGKLLG